MAGIFYSDYHVPDKFVGVAEVLNNCTNLTLPKGYNSIDKLYSYYTDVLGYNRIAIEDEGSIVEVFFSLIENFFEKTKVDPRDISLIINSNHQRFTRSDNVNVSYLIQKEYGLRNASVLSIEQACGGTLAAIGPASSLLAKKGKYAIILSYFHIIQYERRPTDIFIYGDGAGLMVISQESTDYDIVDFASVADGSKSYEIYHRSVSESNILEVAQHGADFIRTITSKNNIEIKDLFVIIAQNVGRLIYGELYQRLLGLPASKFFLQNIPNGGYQGPVDTPHNFTDFINEYSPSKGAYILLYGVASDNTGTSYQAVLLKCNKK